MSLILEDYIWHALYCAPQRELRVAHDLSARGHPAIVPAEKAWKERKGHTIVTRKPVMPRYVFTGFREAPDWERLRRTIPNLWGYMQFGLGPTKMRIADVKWLYDLRETLAGRQRPTVVEGVIRVGSKVRVVNGVFSGETIYVDKVVADRIHTIREFLGAPRLFKIPVADLAVI